MAFTGAAVHALEMRDLLRSYLATEITAIDTAANAVLASGDQFTTPTLANADIQLFRDDREGECISVVIMPEGIANPRGEQRHGTGSGRARMDYEHDFTVYVSARSDTGSWGDHGAWYRADRVMHGVLACLLKYPKQDGTVTFWVEVGGWRRMEGEDPSHTLAATFAADVVVRDRAVA